jgi:hypothetical protein
MFGERDASTCGWSAGELVFRGAVKPEATGDDVFAGHAQVDGEMQVRDLVNVLSDHPGVPLPCNQLVVVDDLVMDELGKFVRTCRSAHLSGRGIRARDRCSRAAPTSSESSILHCHQSAMNHHRGRPDHKTTPAPRRSTRSTTRHARPISGPNRHYDHEGQDCSAGVKPHPRQATGGRVAPWTGGRVIHPSRVIVRRTRRAGCATGTHVCGTHC